MTIRYFNNCATTRVDDDVMDIIKLYSTQYYYNPSALGSSSAMIAKAINDSRITIAQCIGADSNEIIFTSGGTESNNIAVTGSVKARVGNVVMTDCEHSSVHATAMALQDKGYEIRIAKCLSDGSIDTEHYLSLIDSNTVLAIMMHVNNETGAINDIKRLCNDVKYYNNNTIVFCDGVQAFGKIAVNVKNLGVDLYSMSGHKIHASKGVGALFIKSGVKIRCLMYGGKQEKDLRSGTEYVAGIVGMGIATSKACKMILQLSHSHIGYKDKIVNTLNHIGDCCILCDNNAVPNILTVGIANIKSEVLVNMLEMDGIIVGTSSACSAKNTKGNRMYKSIGIQEKYKSGIIRISFSKYTTNEDVEMLCQKLTQNISTLRKTIGKIK